MEEEVKKVEDELFHGNMCKELYFKNRLELKMMWVRLEYPESLAKVVGNKFVIKSFPMSQWNAFERNERENHVVWWFQLGGFKSMEIIHDCRVLGNIELLKVK